MISPRGARILGLLAVVSVAINLFLAGSMLGGQFRRLPPNMTFDQRLDTALDELPDADKPIAKEIFAQHHDEIVQKWHASRIAAQRAIKALRAKTLNQAEVRADFDAANDRFTEFRKAVQDMILEVGGKISAEGRQRLRAAGGAL